MSSFDDHFGAVSHHYADCRPIYPPELFDWLASQCVERDLAWDCGAGNGQASTELGRLFAQVIATDASEAQIGRAIPHPHVSYRVAPADASGIDTATADIVTAAQALHWFDLERFYAEVRRVLKPGGLIAAWTYGAQAIADEAIDALVRRYHYEEIGPWWPPERRHVESGYRDLPFPFQPVPAPAFTMTARWNLLQLSGYLRSWSATARFIAEKGVDPVTDLETRLRPLWGDERQSRTIEWPLALLVGRV